MQNDMRDRLVELLSIIPCNAESCSAVCDGRCQEFDDLDRCQIGQLADHLIANGVIVPPCKVGQTVWFIRKSGLRNELIETTVEKIISKKGGIFLKLACNSMYETSCNSIGKTVFLTKDQAEQKLKELSGNG